MNVTVLMFVTLPDIVQLKLLFELSNTIVSTVAVLPGARLQLQFVPAL